MTITITMTPQLFKNHIIELVSKNGLPLSLFKQSGFLGIIEAILFLRTNFYE